MFDQVNFNEDPALPDLRAWYCSSPRLFLQRNGMNFQEGGSLLQGERTHAVSPATTSRWGKPVETEHLDGSTSSRQHQVNLRLPA